MGRTQRHARDRLDIRMPEALRIDHLGDRAVVLTLTDRPSPEAARRAADLAARLDRMAEAAGIKGLLGMAPAFGSVTVRFDPVCIDLDRLLVLAEAAAAEAIDTGAGRHVVLPACFEGDLAPDLDHVARATNLSAHAVIAAMTGRDLVVLGLGFAPGFAYLGPTDTTLHLPRRDNPRGRVPRGSVAIARDMAAIYPMATPGGWHLLGHCPVPLFVAGRTPPALLSTGDTVRLAPVDRACHADLQARAEAGVDPEALLGGSA